MTSQSTLDEEMVRIARTSATRPAPGGERVPGARSPERAGGPARRASFASAGSPGPWLPVDRGRAGFGDGRAPRGLPSPERDEGHGGHHPHRGGGGERGRGIGVATSAWAAPGWAGSRRIAPSGGGREGAWTDRVARRLPGTATGRTALPETSAPLARAPREASHATSIRSQAEDAAHRHAPAMRGYRFLVPIGSTDGSTGPRAPARGGEPADQASRPIGASKLDACRRAVGTGVPDGRPRGGRSA